MVSPIERLTAIEDIRRLKARYFRCLDEKTWEALRDIFTPDAILDVRGGMEENPVVADFGEPIRGVDAIVAFFGSRLASVTTVHAGHSAEIDVVSVTEASGVWGMADVLRPPAGGPFALFRGFGRYHETYRNEGGGWRIATLRLTRTMVEFERNGAVPTNRSA